MTSGVSTTHYMAVEEMRKDNSIFVAYDFGWTKEPGRYTYGRKVNIAINRLSSESQTGKSSDEKGK